MTRRWIAVMSLVSICAALTMSSPAQAAVIRVTTFNDDVAGACNSHCTLREAIIKANATEASDTITLARGIYLVELPAVQNDESAGTDLNITNPLILKGAPNGGTVIQALDSVVLLPTGVMTVGTDATLTMSNVTLAGGGWGLQSAPGSSTTLDRVVIRNARGSGAIVNQGAMSIKNSAIGPSNTDPLGSAGGIDSSGTLTMENSSIFGNTALGLLSNPSGVGLRVSAGSVSLNNVTIYDNVAVAAGVDGNQVFRGGTSTITASNTVIADSENAQLGSPCGAVGDEKAITTSLGYNFFGTDGENDCATLVGGDVSGAAPDLERVYRGFFGQSSYWVPADEDGPLVDAGNPAATGPAPACVAKDQRGTARPKDGDGTAAAVCDIGAVEFIVDGTPPTPSIAKPSAANTFSKNFTVQWKATDAGSGVDHFDVFVRSGPIGGTLGGAKQLKNDVDAGSMAFQGKFGNRYCFTTSAVDNNGNASAQSAQKCTNVKKP